MTNLRKSQTYHLRTHLLFNFGNSFRLGQVPNMRSNCEHVTQLRNNTNDQTCNAQTKATELAITQSITNLGERGKLREKKLKVITNLKLRFTNEDL